MSDDELVKSKSDSSKRRFFIQGLKSKKSKSAPVSPNVSPSRRSSLASIYSPRDIYSCFWCKSKLQTNEDSVLAIKCGCHPPMYFCSKLCHRSHWVDPSNGRCNQILFANIDLTLRWDESEYVHARTTVEDTLTFPIDTKILSNAISALQLFKDNINMADITTAIANINYVLSFKIAVIPLSKHNFELVFINKESINFGEYNLILKTLDSFFRSPNIPDLLTNKLKLEIEN